MHPNRTTHRFLLRVTHLSVRLTKVLCRARSSLTITKAPSSSSNPPMRPRSAPCSPTQGAIPTPAHKPHEKSLKVRQNASNHMPPLRPAAPVLMRLRPWRTFESKEPYIAGRCGGGTTARAGPKRAFFLPLEQLHSSGREKAASWAACAVAGALWRGWAIAALPRRLSRRGGHPGRPARAFAACSFS